MSNKVELDDVVIFVENLTNECKVFFNKGINSNLSVYINMYNPKVIKDFFDDQKGHMYYFLLKEDDKFSYELKKNALNNQKELLFSLVLSCLSSHKNDEKSSLVVEVKNFLIHKQLVFLLSRK